LAESYVVVIGLAEGRKTAERHPIPHTQLALALVRQQYERLSDRAINDVIKDLQHEKHRRAGTLAQLGGWDPNKTQFRGGPK
jgi:hypothetical protein